MMLARLSRIVPLLVALALLAAIVYLVVTYRHSPSRAKEVLIKLFTILTSALGGFFGLVSLYAWFESNEAVFDLAFSFLVVALIGLGVTLACRHVFLKHHPEYRKKRERVRRLGTRGGRHKD